MIIDICPKEAGDKHNCINYTKLLKLAYLCDREMLKKKQQSITGDEVYNMDHGPVLTNLYGLIKQNQNDENQKSWDKYFTREGYLLKIKSEIEIPSSLTDEEECIVKEVVAVLGHLSWYKLIRYCHKFLPEWSDPYGTSKHVEKKYLLKLLARET